MEQRNDPRAAVQRMFAAFGASDVDGIIETVDTESRWVYYGANPRLSHAEFSGHAAVRKFFERILKRLEIEAFDTREFVVQGDTVVIFGSESGTVRSTGEPFRNEWVQKYVVKDGLITNMAEYNVQVDPPA